MPVTFPVPLADFFSEIGIASATLHIPDIRASKMTGGGNLITMNVRPRLWYGTISIRPYYAEDADRVSILADQQLQAGASFLVTDPRRPWPAADPNGTTLGAATPTLSAVSTDRREIDIAGLPVGYRLQTGDLFSFTFGTPTAYALHRVRGDETADGTGAITGLEVYPPIEEGEPANAPLTLVNPVCEAEITPGSYSPQQQRPVITDGFTFNWMQTL